MKRVCLNHQHRRGTIFLYFIGYLALAGALAGAAGISLHTILKAQGADREFVTSLNQLKRLEQSLRDDVDMSPATVVSMSVQAADSPAENQFVITTDDGLTVRYVIDGCVVQRTQTNSDGQVVSRDRFLLPVGSLPGFAEDLRPSEPGVVFRMAVATPGRPASFDASVNGQVIEIYLGRSMTPQTSDENSPGDSKPGNRKPGDSENEATATDNVIDGVGMGASEGAFR